MPCKAEFNKEQALCTIYRVFIHQKGNNYYHGEKCGGCMWWEDTAQDRDFKFRLWKITGERI